MGGDRALYSAQDVYWLKRALKNALTAQELGEVPVGAVLVHKNVLVAEGFNQPIQNHDPSAHAEMLVLRKAGQYLKNYRLTNTILYVTLEPCAMCAAAIMHARIGKVVFGAHDLKAGAFGSVLQIKDSLQHLHKLDVLGGVLEKECGDLLRHFFKIRRSSRLTQEE